MWSSIEKLLNKFPRERFVMIENGAPRYVVLSFEAYQELLEVRKQQESAPPIIESKHEEEGITHNAEQINNALQEVAAQETIVQHESALHEDEEHVTESAYAPDFPKSEAIGGKSQSFRAPDFPKSEAIGGKSQFPDLFKSEAIEDKSQSFRAFRAPARPQGFRSMAVSIDDLPL